MIPDIDYHSPTVDHVSYIVLPHNTGFFNKKQPSEMNQRWDNGNSCTPISMLMCTAAHDIRPDCLLSEGRSNDPLKRPQHWNFGGGAWQLSSLLMLLWHHPIFPPQPRLIAFSGEGLRWIVGMVLTSISKDWGRREGWHACQVVVQGQSRLELDRCWVEGFVGTFWLFPTPFATMRCSQPRLISLQNEGTQLWKSTENPAYKMQFSGYVKSLNFYVMLLNLISTCVL